MGVLSVRNCNTWGFTNTSKYQPLNLPKENVYVVLYLTYIKSLKDDLFKKRFSQEDFVFDDQVAQVFDDMIARSIPGYATIISTIGQFAKKYYKSNSQIYDLGCSLGGVTFEICKQLEESDFNLIAIDNSEAMIERLLQRKAIIGGLEDRVEILFADINDVVIENASIVILNFTLQFLPPKYRNRLVKRIYDGLIPGGILILSEKIIFSDENFNNLFVEMYHKFKESNGYSELEISQKRLALENILIPETLGMHKRRHVSAGFQSFEVWFQNLNFASTISLK